VVLGTRTGLVRVPQAAGVSIVPIVAHGAVVQDAGSSGQKEDRSVAPLE